MTVHSISKRSAYLATGGLGILLSAGYLAMATQLPLGEMDAPGAGLFPVLVGAIMCFASLTTVWEGWQTPRADGIELPVGQDRARLFKLIFLLKLSVTRCLWWLLISLCGNGLLISLCGNGLLPTHLRRYLRIVWHSSGLTNLLGSQLMTNSWLSCGICVS